MVKFNTFIPPMLLSERATPFDSKDYIYEIKIDGIRAMVHASPKGVRIFSRRGNDITNTYPELAGIKNFVSTKVIFDGEIVAFQDGVPSFSKLQKRNLMKNKTKIKEMSISEPVAFVAFDCIFEGRDLTSMTTLERKEVLDKYPDDEVFIKTKFILEDGKKLFIRIKKLGLEGIVAKKKDSLYYPDFRTKEWIKIKNFRRETFLVGGLVENQSKASLLLGEYRGREFYFVGKVSIMRDNPLYEKLKSYEPLKMSPFVDYDRSEAKYVKPKFRCEVVYIERTPSGHLRQPIFKREEIDDGKFKRI